MKNIVCFNVGKPRFVLFKKKNYKNLRGWGGRGNLGFPTIKYILTQKPNVFFFGSNVNFIKALKRYELLCRETQVAPHPIPLD